MIIFAFSIVMAGINTEKKGDLGRSPEKISGYLAISPLFVFLAVYVLTSILAHDFYKVPITAAFIVSSAYALAITKGLNLDGRISIFSSGAGDKNVLLMIWIFVLAGAFAATAKDIGSIDATVNFALRFLPGKLVFAGIFLASCFISMAIGTSVGTIVALVPVACGIAAETGVDTAFMTAIVVGGAFFGDNLSFISDTTIAATKSQGCSMSDKFKANAAIAIPAALIVTGIYVFQGLSVDFVPAANPIDWIKLIPYILVIVLALIGMNVIGVLAIGIAANFIVGVATGSAGWVAFLSSAGGGISGMGELIIVTLLAGGMLELIRYNGGIEFIISGLTRKIHGQRGAECCIAALVSLANICTANNTIAIITTGGIARNISERFGIDPRKSASILDTFSCMIQGILPYGAQMLMASGLAGVSGVAIISSLYYPFALGIIAMLSILFRFPRNIS